MAFSDTARQSGNRGTSSHLVLTTDSATPTANSLFLVCSAAQNDSVQTAPDFLAPSGGSLSYTQVAEIGDDELFQWDGNANFRLSSVIFRAAIGGSPTAFTVTIDYFSDDTSAFYAALCLDITGHDHANPIAQSAANGTGTGPGGAGDDLVGTVTLGSTPSVGSLVVVAFGSGADEGGGFGTTTIGGQSMTPLPTNQDTAFTQAGVFYRVIDGTESDNTITCSDMGDVVGNWTAVAVEVNADSGGGGVTASGAAQAAAAEVSGAAEVGVSVSGQVSPAAGELAGTAEVDVAGSGAAAPRAATLAGTSTVPAAASGQATVPAAELSGTAAMEVSASGAAPAAAAATTGSAEAVVAVSGAARAPAARAAGTIGTPAVDASGTARAPAARAAGTGTVDVNAGGSAASPPATMAGAAAVQVEGSGSAVAPAARAAGTAVGGELSVPVVRVSGSHQLIATAAGKHELVSTVPGRHQLVVTAQGRFPS